MKPLTKSLKAGQFFYVVTPHPDDRKRQYLYHIERTTVEFQEPKFKLSPIRSSARKFNNLDLARCFADFLNRLSGDVQFCVSVE